MDPYEVVTVDYKLKFNRDLEELQTDLVKATSANAYSWIKKGNLTKELAKDFERILDVGCGWGRELIRLKSAVGVDLCLPFLKAARNYVCNDVVLASAAFLPFKEAAFDFLIVSEVLEHLYDPEKAMGEAVRVLRNGGKIVLQTPNSQLTRQKFVAKRYGHVHEFNPKELFRFLSSFGFQDLRRFGSTIPYVPSGSRLSILNEKAIFFRLWRLLDKLCPLKWDIIIFATLTKPTEC
jgi:ubiquinone/menaquinone biosynthesis C-methylase UbiE